MQWVVGLALRSPPSPNGTDSFNRREFGSSIFLGPPPQEGEAALNVPNALTAPAFENANGFASARVKHDLNDVGPITAANALELFLSLFADQLESTKKVHVTLLMGIQ